MLAQKNSEEIARKIVPVIFEQNSEPIKPHSHAKKFTAEVDEMQSFVEKKSNQR